ncbi:MAG: HAMP domain-containing sensor histidine kinase, partial [Chloroflexota bacterium]
MTTETPNDDAGDGEVDQRVSAIATDADLSDVATALATARETVLARWVEVTGRQSFHAGRHGHGVADHVPQLFDAVVALLRRSVPPGDDMDAPLDDPAIVAAATAHAEVRFEQGLGPIAVVTEFRLLRQEIGRALIRTLDDAVPSSDVVAGMAIVSDALDGSATVGLAALSDRIETLRESFLATTLHDVRQPITLVEGSLHLADRWLTAPDPDTDRVHETIVDALAATSELVAMIDTMSDASRVALGELHPDPEPASLEDVVRSVIATFGAAARTRVTADIPDGRHLIGLWDAGLLRRVVTNLIGNALKYSGPDGPVLVTVMPEAGSACLTVRDHGLGLTAEEMPTIFERFTRADRVRSKGIPGLGLGLYACRGIVHAHGGTIELRSSGAGHGTTAVVRLPLLAEDDPA